jgi:hypothetical protein
MGPLCKKVIIPITAIVMNKKKTFYLRSHGKLVISGCQAGYTVFYHTFRKCIPKFYRYGF